MKKVTPFILVGLLTCCAAKSPADQCTAWETKLGSRLQLELKGNGGVSIKRDVHSIDIDEEAGKVADAFHKTMTDPSKRFGLIHVMRIPHDNQSESPSRSTRNSRDATRSKTL